MKRTINQFSLEEIFDDPDSSSNSRTSSSSFESSVPSRKPKRFSSVRLTTNLEFGIHIPIREKHSNETSDALDISHLYTYDLGTISGLKTRSSKSVEDYRFYANVVTSKSNIPITPFSKLVPEIDYELNETKAISILIKGPAFEFMSNLHTNSVEGKESEEKKEKDVNFRSLKYLGDDLYSMLDDIKSTKNILREQNLDLLFPTITRIAGTYDSNVEKLEQAFAQNENLNGITNILLGNGLVPEYLWLFFFFLHLSLFGEEHKSSSTTFISQLSSHGLWSKNYKGIIDHIKYNLAHTNGQFSENGFDTTHKIFSHWYPALCELVSTNKTILNLAFYDGKEEQFFKDFEVYMNEPSRFDELLSSKMIEENILKFISAYTQYTNIFSQSIRKHLRITYTITITYEIDGEEDLDSKIENLLNSQNDTISTIISQNVRFLQIHSIRNYPSNSQTKSKDKNTIIVTSNTTTTTTTTTTTNTTNTSTISPISTTTTGTTTVHKNGKYSKHVLDEVHMTDSYLLDEKSDFEIESDIIKTTKKKMDDNDQLEERVVSNSNSSTSKPKKTTKASTKSEKVTTSVTKDQKSTKKNL